MFFSLSEREEGGVGGGGHRPVSLFQAQCQDTFYIKKNDALSLSLDLFLSLCLSDLPSSFDLISSKFLQSSTVECVLISESEVSLVVVGIHFVSP